MIKETSVIWCNGNVVPWKEAKTHVFSHGLNCSGSVFEGIRVYNFKPFFLSEHVSRLFKSAETLRFKIPYDQALVEEAINSLIQTEQIEMGYIRPLAWVSSEHPAIFNKNEVVSLSIIAIKMKDLFSEDQRSSGIRLKISSFIRPAYNMSLAQSKASAHYIVSCNAVQEAKSLGYDDSLILDSRGYVTEASGANIFMVKDQVLTTPIADCFLNGITRQIVIKLAQDNGICVVEKHITLKELVEAEEIFLTGTAYEILPVRQIDNYAFSPSLVTKRLREAFDEISKKKKELI